MDRRQISEIVSDRFNAGQPPFRRVTAHAVQQSVTADLLLVAYHIGRHAAEAERGDRGTRIQEGEALPDQRVFPV